MKNPTKTRVYIGNFYNKSPKYSGKNVDESV